MSLRDVARQAGVAISTVSRVLSDHPDVSDETKDRVMAIVTDLGYRPNAVGRMLRQGATHTIGFAIGDISNPLLSQIALGAETELRQHGYSLLLSNSMNDAAREIQNLQTFEQRQVDGLLLSITQEADQQLTQTLRRFDRPAVAIDRDIAALQQVSSVYSDHANGITLAVEALAQAGHHKIALISGLARLRPGQARIVAARAATMARGMECTMLSSDNSGGPLPEEIVALLDSTDRPSAVIAGNNQILGVVLDAFAHTGLSYPHDISLVTCDEVTLQRFITPAIATIHRDSYELGQVAADLLLEQLGGASSTPRHVELPTSFTAAASIAAPL